MASIPKNADRVTDSDFLRAARAKTLLGRSGFAKLLGVSTWHVRNIERGDSDLSPRLKRIIESLGLRPDNSVAGKNFRYGRNDSDYLKRSRQILNLSQRQLATSCGVRASMIQNIEARRSLISNKLRLTIRELLLLGEV